MYKLYVKPQILKWLLDYGKEEGLDDFPNEIIAEKFLRSIKTRKKKGKKGSWGQYSTQPKIFSKKFKMPEQLLINQGEKTDENLIRLNVCGSVFNSFFISACNVFNVDSGSGGLFKTNLIQHLLVYELWNKYGDTAKSYEIAKTPLIEMPPEVEEVVNKSFNSIPESAENLIINGESKNQLEIKEQDPIQEQIDQIKTMTVEYIKYPFVDDIRVKHAPAVEEFVIDVIMYVNQQEVVIRQTIDETILEKNKLDKELEIEAMIGNLSVTIEKRHAELIKSKIEREEEPEEEQPKIAYKGMRKVNNPKGNVDQEKLKKTIGSFFIPDSIQEGTIYQGKKELSGKTMYSLIPAYVKKGIAEILTEAAKKYGVNNWQDFEPTQETIDMWYDASERHIQEFLEYRENPTIKSRYNSKDFGHHHLLHAITDLIFIHWYDTKDLQGDYKIKEK